MTAEYPKGFPLPVRQEFVIMDAFPQNPLPEWLEISPIGDNKFQVTLIGQVVKSANDICTSIGEDMGGLEKEPNLPDCIPALSAIAGVQIVGGKFSEGVNSFKILTSNDQQDVVFTNKKLEVPKEIFFKAIVESSEPVIQIPTQTPEPSLDLYLKTNYPLICGVAFTFAFLLGFSAMTYGYIRAGIRQSRE